MRYAAEQGMMSIELEIDCLNLKNALHSDEWDAAPEGMLFREILFTLFFQFCYPNVCYSFM
jgi:hypothetical protein